VLEGTQGVGVILAETSENVQAILETLQLARQNVLLQRFVAECRGRDVRAVVVGDRVVASMRRTARSGEFRANVHRGGRAEGAVLAPELSALAIRAARILGLEVAGVDLLESDDGPKVIEVNASPGLEGIEEASGVDVASTIIEHLEEKASARVRPQLLRARVGAGGRR
jgi:ribosomal protein S6--L-glutamate ligase